MRTNKVGDRLLHRAVRENDISSVTILLGCSSVNLNSVNRDGETPIYIALRSYFEKIFTSLAIAGADLSRRYKHGKSLVYVAAERNAVNFVGVLIKQGADVDRPTKHWRQTPLYIASKKGYSQVIKLT